MKKLTLLAFAFIAPFILSACPTANVVTPTSSPSSYDSYNSPSIAPSAAATSTPSPSKDLSSLRAGVLPDPTLTESEKKLAGMLVRLTKPVFPLKVGVLLYRNADILNDSDRRKNLESFIEKIKQNSNIGQVIEISSNLIPANSGLEEIRALGARFQVASVLVINESYQYPQENNEAVITPIDRITGTRTWESFSNIEVYSIDILNGVMLFSTASGSKQTEKYNRNNSNVKNPDTNLIRIAANTAWKGIEDKVSNEISAYKKRLDENKIIPVALDNKI